MEEDGGASLYFNVWEMGKNLHKSTPAEKRERFAREKTRLVCKNQWWEYTYCLRIILILFLNYRLTTLVSHLAKSLQLEEKRGSHRAFLPKFTAPHFQSMEKPRRRGLAISAPLLSINLFPPDPALCAHVGGTNCMRTFMTWERISPRATTLKPLA